MSEARTPRFDWGQRVTAVDNLFNDGSHPDGDAQQLLVSEGSAGEVVQVGLHTDSGVLVYMVEFDGRVVGCFEDEIAPLQATAIGALR
jgi:nitrogen fixation protein NifZ